ncbi:hypothetical protein AVEN_95819-1 [Araneus ventricosus]|uniref:Uncharacterized protein n=1 Tax=Araneus ventricosus TaxID=182803 RepID=A0A4Y2LXC0_ARAVE|nr:hypothetical protein AVEN_95819-1 [Araneus ventricosus]
MKQYEGYFGTDVIIFNPGQLTRKTPDLPPLSPSCHIEHKLHIYVSPIPSYSFNSTAAWIIGSRLHLLFPPLDYACVQECEDRVEKHTRRMN